MPKYIAWFKDLSKEDISIAGGKGANLGEMFRAGIPIPNGFVITSRAYFDFILHHKLSSQIQYLVEQTDVNDSLSLQRLSTNLQALIKKFPLPDPMAQEIMFAYRQLSGWLGLKNLPVAVRSSATAEDLPEASFAGQQETFLNVIGESNLIGRVQDCWASLFTPRAIFYRSKNHFDHLKVGIAVPVQKLINSLISGIIFTANPVNQDKSQIILECIWGLGEYIVQGTVTPDQFVIEKHTYKILSQNPCPQKIQLLRSKSETKSENIPKHLQSKPKLTEKEVVSLAKLAQKIHNHYGKPQDIEFAIDQDRKVFIVQSRPITTLDKKNSQNSTFSSPILLTGQSASPGQASGQVVIVKSPADISKVKPGQILVATMTSPDYVPAMKKVAAIVTDQGGQTSHAAIVSRELGVPCVVGTQTATKVLKPNQEITVDANTGHIHAGLQMILKPKSLTTPTKKIHTATKLYVNLGEPDLAKEVAKKNVDGIGLLRAEFIMANIGLHPKHVIAENQQEAYIKKLTSELLKFARSFSPRPIIYRATDFKSNEYKHLKWGFRYEQDEPNPLLGFRGAARYIVNPDVFNLELEAIKRVRNKFGYRNLHLMIPFVRSPYELQQVKNIVTQAGLLRSPSFKLHMMVELPTNVIQLDDFIQVGIDGVSIGSNDLTMLVLGTDRDNQEVAKAYNEMDPSVLWFLEKTVKTCLKHHITCSICGQAPSNYPELTEKLVSWGITSISVSPDAISHTRELIYQSEKKLFTSKR